jgi:hypothetical protein
MLGQIYPPAIVANSLQSTTRKRTSTSTSTSTRTSTSTSTIARKTCTCPEGGTGLSPGFQPWELHPNGCALKGHETARTNNTVVKYRFHMVSIANSHPIASRPFRENRLHGWFPGLKPWVSLLNRARYRYRSRPPSSVADRRGGSRDSYSPKGQESLAHGSPWVSLLNRARARYRYRSRPPSSSSLRVRRDALLTSRQAVPACYPRDEIPGLCFLTASGHRYAGPVVWPHPTRKN